MVYAPASTSPDVQSYSPAAPLCGPPPQPKTRKPPRNAPGCHAVPPVAARIHHGLAAQSRWASYTCEFLVTRVLRQQHAVIREELRRLRQLTHAAVEPVATDSGTTPGSLRPGLHAIRERVDVLATELTDDIAAEEPVFTNMLELELAYVGHHPGSAHPHPAGESLDRIAEQHQHYAAQLRHLRSDAIRLTTARTATAADRRLSDHILQFDRLLLDHFHLEDEVLLPRIARMEAELFA